MNKISNDKLGEIANAYRIQEDQRRKAEYAVGAIDKELDELINIHSKQGEDLNKLLQKARTLAATMGYSEADITDEIKNTANEVIKANLKEIDETIEQNYEIIPTVDVSGSWDDYYLSVKEYAKKNDMDLSKDPFYELLSETEKNELGRRIREDYLVKSAKCDKYDYAIAAFCGIVSGLVDSFFVGMPNDSKLGKWTDEQADKFTMSVFRKIWKLDEKKRSEIQDLFARKEISIEQRNEMLKEAGIPYNQNVNKEPTTLQQCIQYGEKKFGVNYDASSAAYVKEKGVLSGMNPGNHHIKSLAHCPSLVGLIFSIIDQFTGKASFVDNGKIIQVTPVEKKNEIDRFELRGKSFPAKMICGIVNWLGHLLSDLVGSNRTRSKEGTRGSGLPVPLMEVLQLCTFNVPDRNGASISISELTVKLFEKGYDVRFAAACAIPVVINEFFIHLFWSIKARFYHKKTWNEAMEFRNQPELRRMLLIGHGVLCIVDASDATVRTIKKGGELLYFSLHLNIVAWERLAVAGLQEVRNLYKEKVIDVVALDEDLEIEWKKLYHEVCPGGNLYSL